MIVRQVFCANGQNTWVVCPIRLPTSMQVVSSLSKLRLLLPCREANPEKFKSRSTNKMAYFRIAAKDYFAGARSLASSQLNCSPVYFTHPCAFVLYSSLLPSLLEGSYAGCNPPCTFLLPRLLRSHCFPSLFTVSWVVRAHCFPSLFTVSWVVRAARRLYGPPEQCEAVLRRGQGGAARCTGVDRRQPAQLLGRHRHVELQYASRTVRLCFPSPCVPHRVASRNRSASVMDAQSRCKAPLQTSLPCQGVLVAASMPYCAHG